MFTPQCADRQRCDILHVRERSGTLLQVHERGRHQTLLPGPPEMRRVDAQAELREGSRSRFKTDVIELLRHTSRHICQIKNEILNNFEMIFINGKRLLNLFFLCSFFLFYLSNSPLTNE